MRLCLKIEDAGLDVKAAGVVPGKDGVTRDARRYVRGAGGGLGGRDA